jgi:hypothetical protein
MNAFVDIRMYVLTPDLRKAEYDQNPLIFFNISKLLQPETNET